MNNPSDETSLSETESAIGNPELIETELDDLAHALRGTWHSVLRGVAISSKLEGVHGQQFWVLVTLSHGSMKMSDLAQRTEISHASMTGIIDRLEERGLVERGRSTGDRRVVTVSITPGGRDALCHVHRQFTERLEDVLAPLSADERHTLLGLLTKVSGHRKGS